LRLRFQDRKHAYQRFSRLAAKRGWFEAPGDSPVPGTAEPESAKKGRATAKRAAPKKQAAADDAEDEEEDEDQNESPVKKAKTGQVYFVGGHDDEV
jgi:hypothetical protein